MLVPVRLDKLLTAKVAVAGVPLVTPVPLSIAENPGVLPPAVKPTTGPAGILVGWLPAATDLMAKLSVQVPVVVVACGTEPPERMIKLPFAGTDTEPKPQVSTTVGVAATVTPVGKLNVIAALLRPLRVLSLNSEMVSWSASPGLIVAGL